MIYTADFSSLSHIVETIHKKHYLKPEQKICGIEVKIGSKEFVVDMNEGRDWKYVSDMAVLNGGRAEMVVSTIKQEI